jgi:two-component system chemotaxis response regulator CheB
VSDCRGFVGVGTSLGGLRALTVVLGGLPKAFPAAVAVVQHRASTGTDDLVDVLQRECALPVVEADDKLAIAAGHVYVAPAGYHMLVDEDGIALSVDAPVNYARPSVDVLFETAAQTFRAQMVAVVLSGASQDGARGAVAVRRAGGRIVVQDPDTAESRIMPGSVLALVDADAVLSVDRIAPWLGSHVVPI